MANNLLEVQNLTVEFESATGETVQALKGISFEIGKGEILGIAGESGSGKSVTALALMGLLPRQARIKYGSAIFHHTNRPQDLLKLSRPDFEKIRGDHLSMIFQEPMSSLNPLLNCGAQILEAILRHRQIKVKTAEEMVLGLFKQVGLAQPQRIFESYPHQISGGQRQRVMLAMALSCQPGLIIADEPTTALDVITQKGILELIRDLKTETQHSFLFISHDLAVINALCDRVLILKSGKIVEQGPTRQILQNPAHPYTKKLLASRPVFGKKFFHLSNDWEAAGSSKQEKGSLEISAEAIRERNQMLQSQKPILQVENLQTSFWGKRKSIFQLNKPEIKAVDNISFVVYPGETLGIVGESGSGKTTLGRSLVNLIESRSGKIFYQEKDLKTFSAEGWKKVRKDIQFIFQDPFGSLNPRKTVGAAILEVLLFHEIVKNKKEGLEKTAELFQLTGLDPDFLHRYPHEFSGGQRQRISIARALAVQPKVLICDECVSSLDVSVQAQILDLLVDLREKFKLTYLFISHDLAVVSHLSDRIMVMLQGKLVEIANTEELYLQPKKSYTRQLIQSNLNI